MASGYRRLRIYELVIELTHDVHRWTSEWPAKEREDVGDQLTRALHSVGAHISEAGGHSTAKNRQRVLGLASSELDEVEHWLLIAAMLGLIEEDTTPRTSEIGRMLNGLMANPGRR